ncbi:MAG TPA: helix-turn-helix domain-containing protein, partial [Solirubrobacteraceae bacterium]|nr:helix-turn-helix domain-containing protein [Solirubrobacteraceae bacterium]
MTGPAPETTAGSDLAALEAITDAVKDGAGLPAILRAAARALDASLIAIDRSSAVLAVAARSPADERSLMADAAGVLTLELRVADTPVGQLRMRARAEPSPVVLNLVSTLVASEVERVRAPERASEQAGAAFLRSLLAREIADRQDLVARGKEVFVDLEAGGAMLVVRGLPHAPTEEGWRGRMLALVERGARAAAPSVIAALSERHDPGAQAEVLIPVPDEGVSRRAAEGILRELQAGLPGFSFAVGRSRVTEDPLELWRAGQEALLATNVAQGNDERPLLSFDETGAYRLLLGAMSENPAELQRFYSETIEPLVAYDAQYETELVRTVETFLEADGNVAGTAQRLFTHRHTIRYRLERVRDLCGLDVGSSDGREKLSLGLKAMRVLGIAARGGP